MYFPRASAKQSTQVEAPGQGNIKVEAWGWGEDEAAARGEAGGRLARLVERLQRGEKFPETYAYGNRPLREEVLQTFEGADGPRAVLTRNRPGSVVLNTSRLVFLDVDFGRESGGGLLRLLFGRKDPERAALARLGEALQRAGKGAFRIYRTAGGLRALGVDRELDPAGGEALALMSATGTDPNFVKLCKAQKSFRARLSPKAWRMKLKEPPDFPRTDAASRDTFARWLADYERAAAGYATCRYLETVGKAAFGAGDTELVALHDRMTRSTENLPLA